MSKKNKIILIGFSLVFLLALGIYLYPDEAPMFVDQGMPVPTEKPKPPPKRVAAAGPAKKPAPAVSLKNKAAPAQPAPEKKSQPNPYVSYPQGVLKMLGIDMDSLIAQQDRFKNTIVHVEWMDHVNDVLQNLDPDKKAAIIQNHTALLYIKDELNKAYLTGKIDHETFIKTLSDLMKWHQKTYESILSRGEYEALFEVKPEAAGDMIDDLLAAAPKYSFILNQDIPEEEIINQVDPAKLEAVDTHFKKMVLDRDEIGKKINAGEMTLEQARAAMYESQQAFIAKCKEILTEAEINTIFGSVAGLESGSTRTQAPAVLGDSDKQVLGFEIENPQTSIDMVKKKLDPATIEDLKFFYQQREKEREDLITRLDAGELKETDIENASNEMDAAFEENCRSVLTDEEYQLIFGKPEKPEIKTAPADIKTPKAAEKPESPGEAASAETLKKLTDQEITEESKK